MPLLSRERRQDSTASCTTSPQAVTQNPPLFPKPHFFPCNLNGPMCDPFDKLFLEEVLLDVGNQLVFPFTGPPSLLRSASRARLPALCMQHQAVEEGAFRPQSPFLRHQAFRQALPRVSPFYAVKCNSSPWMLRVLAALGTNLDCASQGELEQVLDLGVAPSRILYANPCKPVSHIRFAALHGVKLLVFDSEEELIKVAQHHPGASFHVGSRCQTPHNFMKAIANCRRALGEGVEGGHRKLLYYLNDGHYGTFRVFPREPEPRTPIVVKELGPKPPLFPCTLFGPTCDALDKLFLKEVQLPELDVGDWLVFPFMGAYTSVMSSTFNGFSPASIYYAMGPELRRHSDKHLQRAPLGWRGASEGPCDHRGPAS
ncbi:hypothetical protein Celaphus_00014891 [Cervus elaphus hippelaphus]|uniref:Uncharacterized protein n=1 Tax=Cervus elaphus hippelaphus TaxID=46360 RepID=A0A212D379_CEREH|nr:hypothetical protein Celaphus_00014891 [Cervus elaphus hippelaphus]